MRTTGRKALCATVMHVYVTLPVVITFMLSAMNCSTVHMMMMFM